MSHSFQLYQIESSQLVLGNFFFTGLPITHNKYTFSATYARTPLSPNFALGSTVTDIDLFPSLSILCGTRIVSSVLDEELISLAMVSDLPRTARYVGMCLLRKQAPHLQVVSFSIQVPHKEKAHDFLFKILTVVAPHKLVTICGQYRYQLIYAMRLFICSAQTWLELF